MYSFAPGAVRWRLFASVTSGVHTFHSKDALVFVCAYRKFTSDLEFRSICIQKVICIEVFIINVSANA
ncbi:hypothetical protein XELAEV_18041848mg [Xenopus laevis]|uniref:Uncharacterized protein n=1 Tax=Xenopus laevis TaxID=8355 RepID=A0A974C438_XENLA|nr:hypothetical protein XELAEV_18041848mg [Xenopus laevis]